MENTDVLKNISYKDTKPFIPNIILGKVIKVYDGDTITIATKLINDMSEIYRFNVRLSGIDTPEIKSKNKNEKEKAKIVRDNLSELILNKIVHVKNIKTEKYGRLLANVFYGDIDISEWLLEKSFALKYNGGTKQLWNDENLNNIKGVNK